MKPAPTAVITNLARQLLASADAQDWPRLAELDRQVAHVLGRRGALSVELQPELMTLKQAHRQALIRARTVRDQMRGRIDELKHNQEGLKAYAQSGELL